MFLVIEHQAVNRDTSLGLLGVKLYIYTYGCLEEKLSFKLKYRIMQPTPWFSGGDMMLKVTMQRE